jgi:uncharacterized membrane protein YhhN
MDWSRFQAALIRAFWTVVFPLIGALVNWLATGENLKEIGVTNAAVILVVSGALYGLKKFIWPDTVL